MGIVGQGGVVRGPLDEALSAPTEDGRPSVAGEDRHKIGVIFVHGIGDQRAGTTLVGWTKPLVRLIGQWTATTPGVSPSIDPVVSGNIDFSGSTFPTVELEIPSSGLHPRQRWVLTESWWATRVLPPTVSEMFRWLVPGEMWRIFKGIIHGNASQGSRFWWVLDHVFATLLMLPSAVLAVLLYLLFRVLGVLPIAPLQQSAFVRGLEFFLVDWFGDVRILLTDRAQAANIRNRVALSIKALRKYGCGTVVIVGHSGGTIVSYMTLTDPSLYDRRVDLLITHGQALGMAWGLGHASDPWSADQRSDRLYEGDRLHTSLAETIGDVANPGPRGGLRWFDYWATHDPAPSGGFGRGSDDVTQPEQCGGETIRVFNRMSLRGDHGAYWDNDEGFVLPVARQIEQSAGSETSRFFPDEPSISRTQHREDRVRMLSFAWVAVMLSAVVAVPVSMIDARLPGDVGSLEAFGQAAYQIVGRLLTPVAAVAAGFIDLPTLPGVIDGPVAELLGIVFMVALYWIAAKVMVMVWDRWDARERLLGLQPSPDWRSLVPLAIQLGICAGAAISLLLFATSGRAVALIVPGIALAVAIVLSWIYQLTGEIARGEAS